MGASPHIQTIARERARVPRQTTLRCVAPMQSGREIARRDLGPNKMVLLRTSPPRAYYAVVWEGLDLWDVSVWTSARAAWAFATSALRRLRRETLYWSELGEVACGRHAPGYRTDTWNWNRWRRIMPGELTLLRSDSPELARCGCCEDRT